MRILILLLLFFSFSLSTINGQESVGFSDSENIEPLLEYRLPAWGYSNLFWDFSFSSDLRGISRDDDSRATSDILGSLSPTYNRFYESEERVSNRVLTPLINYRRVNDPGFTENENSNRNFELGLNWGLSERFYLDNRDIFLIGSFGGNLRQNHSKQYRSDSNDLTLSDINQLSRFLNSTVGGGIGYGRIRNVNPMIRSLRLNERINELGENQQMNMEDLRNASEQFTKVNGYDQVYDRPGKYFWGDMDAEITPQLMALNPFDLFYLTDVLSESIGQRLEGWEVVARLNLNHIVSYSKTENNVTDTETAQINRSTLLTPSVQGRWYKNLDLKNQIGFNANLSYITDISDNELSYTALNARAEWLHTITDRFLAQPFIYFQRIMNDLNYSTFSAGSSFNYFVENNISLFAEFQYSYSKSELGAFNESINRFQLNAGVRYYMRRGLF